MAVNADEKRSSIIEIAKRRFAHYGMAKTSMAEIVTTLSLSEALAYYYFPDTNSLYSDVLENLIEQSLETAKEAVEKTSTVLEYIHTILEVNMDFKKKYFNVMEYTIVMRKELPAELEAILIRSFER